MKKRINIFIIGSITFILIFGTYFVSADVFGIEWGSSGDEVSFGGGIIPKSTVEEEEETPDTGDEDEPSGGGTTATNLFSLDKSLLVIILPKGEQTSGTIKITNNRETTIPITISIQNLTGIISTPEVNFNLAPNEVKELTINAYVSENLEENIFNGKIKFQSGNFIKYVDVTLDIRDKAPLFDIKTALFKKVLHPGSDAIAKVNVLNLGTLKNIDVELESFITDSEENVYDINKEMFAINDSITKNVSLRIFENMPPGQYFFYSKVSYGNIRAESYDSFKIEMLSPVIMFIFWLLILVLFTLTILIITLLIRHVNKNR